MSIRPKALSLAILAVLAHPQAVNASSLSSSLLDQGLDWSRCEGALAPIPRAQPGEVIVLEGEGAELFPDERIARMAGDVFARQGALEVRAASLVYNEAEQSLKADGGVLASNGPLRLFGESASFDLAAGQALLEAVEYRLIDQHARGSAERVELLDDQRSRYSGITYTTCPPGDEGWLLSASEMEIDRESGIGEGRDAVLRFQDVPIFYTPYIQFPIDDRRMSGLLAPSIGYGDDTGLDIAIPYYFNIAPNMDATVQPRIMSDRGVMLGGEGRYMTRNSYAELDLEWMPDDSGQQAGEDTARGALAFEGRGRAPWDGRYHIDYNYVSDTDYLDDFGDSLAVSAETHLPRRGEIRYRGKQWDLLARALYFQTLDEAIAPSQRPYAMLPQIRFNLAREELLAGLDGRLESEYVRFDRDVGVTGQRVDLYPSLSYPMETVWGFLRPKAGFRHTAYRLDGEGYQDSESRSLPIFSLDAGLFFERDADWFGRAVSQTLEPRLFYLNVPYRDQSELPDFDSALLDFGFGGLFRENRFSGGDRIGDAHQLSMALSSRVLDRTDGSERFRIALGGIFYFEDRRVDLNGAGSDDDASSTLVGEAAAGIGEHWRLRGGIEWDPHGDNEKTRRSSLGLAYRGAEQRLFNLTYRYDDELLEQGDLSFRQPVGDHFDLVGRWNYSLRENETLEVFGGLEYDSCCWKVRAVARRYIKESGGDADNSFFLQLEMKGLAAIGNQLDQFLQRGIFGYEVE